MGKKVLDLLNKDRSMSAIGISVIIGKMPGTIQRVFGSLRRKGLIKKSVLINPVAGKFCCAVGNSRIQK